MMAARSNFFSPSSQQDEDDLSQAIGTQQVHDSGDDDIDDGAGSIQEEDPNVWGYLMSSHGGRIVLKTKSYCVGRSKSCDMRIRDSTVSTRHCTITIENNVAFLTDHKSSNGTYLNGSGRRIPPNSQIRVRSGDWFSLVMPANTEQDIGRRTGQKGLYQRPAPPTANLQTQRPGQPPLPPVAKAYTFMFRAVVHGNPFCGRIRETYEPLAEIGKGAYASVWRAVHKISRQEVAIKIVARKQFAFDKPKMWQDQLNEAIVLKRLDHPSIIRLFDVFESDSALFLVLELVAGGELFDRMVSLGVPYSEDDARLLTKNLLEAIAYLHDRDIVHRDLKPENILLCYKESNVDVKLADFGVAKEERGGRATFCGSMSYIAPEVLQRRDSINGQGKYGKGVDMWSIGVIVFIMLSLSPPFDEADSGDMHACVSQLLRFQGAEWEPVSDCAKDFVAALLEVNESKRLTAQQALAHPWIEFGADGFAQGAGEIGFGESKLSPAGFGGMQIETTAATGSDRRMNIASAMDVIEGDISGNKNKNSNEGVNMLPSPNRVMAAAPSPTLQGNGRSAARTPGNSRKQPLFHYRNSLPPGVMADSVAGRSNPLLGTSPMSAMGAPGGRGAENRYYLSGRLADAYASEAGVGDGKAVDMEAERSPVAKRHCLDVPEETPNLNVKAFE